MATDSNRKSAGRNWKGLLVLWRAAGSSVLYSCGKVQSPQSVDYFTFFGLPRKLT